MNSENASSRDKAVVGSDAMWPALVRPWKAEVGTLLGRVVGTSLWDRHKLFDNVEPCLLLKKAVALGFPVVELVMGVLEEIMISRNP